MNNEAFCISNIGKMREKLDGIDKSFTGLQTAFDPEPHEAAEGAF